MALLGVVALVAGACTATPSAEAPAPVAADPASPDPQQPPDTGERTEADSGTDRTSPADPTGSASTDPDGPDYVDAIERRLMRMANEPRPVDDSAMPPRHLDEERFPTSLVDRTRIVSGGVLPDAIPSIDEPRFEPVRRVDWLEPDEAVLTLEVGAVARAYPVRVLTWHEIVNDEVGGVPVAVTYCPLCNSAVAVDRRTSAGTLDFGTSGALFRSALVMYDRQTETLWTHFDGRAVVGTLVGTQLTRIPVATVSFDEFRSAHPDGEVLTRDTGYTRDYGRNPYPSYEDLDQPLSGFFADDPDPRLPAMSRVIGLGTDEGAVAIPTEHARRVKVMSLEVSGRPVTVWHAPGLASALDGLEVADGRDVGATGVFHTDGPGDPDTFTWTGDAIVDGDTGSTWNLLGEAVDGPLAGHKLEPAVHLDTFWFAWSSYLPDTDLVRPSGG